MRTTPGERADVIQRPMSHVAPETLEWLWTGRIPLGKLTLLAGDPGLGKSFVTIDLAARVSRGGAWPDDPATSQAPGRVILFSAEDDLADTIRPRLDRAGADVSRITAIQGVRRRQSDGAPMAARCFSLRSDLPMLEAVLQRQQSAPASAATAGSDVPPQSTQPIAGNDAHEPTEAGPAVAREPVRLIVIDPISAYCGGTDSNRNADVWELLAPVAELAAKYKVAILAVTHLTKTNNGKAVYRALGSLAFTAAARAVWMVLKDQADSARRLMLPTKLNLSAETSGLAYRLADGKVEWDPEPIRMSADEAIAQELVTFGDRLEREEAVGWLADLLARGPLPAKEIRSLARTNGIPERALRRAKGRLQIHSRRDGFGKGSFVVWTLPHQKERRLAGKSRVAAELDEFLLREKMEFEKNLNEILEI